MNCIILTNELPSFEMKWKEISNSFLPKVSYIIRKFLYPNRDLNPNSNPNPQPIFSYYNDINSLLLVKLGFSFLPIQKIVVYRGR